MSANIEFSRRLGPGPDPQSCYRTFGCPDIFELADGDFAIIGSDITEIAAAKLPPSAGCAPDERIVRIPRKLLVRAKGDIPNAV
jgi:hypothetical protein